MPLVPLFLEFTRNLLYEVHPVTLRFRLFQSGKLCYNQLLGTIVQKRWCGNE